MDGMCKFTENFEEYYETLRFTVLLLRINLATVMECYCSSMELYFEKVKMSNVVDKKSRKYLLNAQK